MSLILAPVQEEDAPDIASLLIAAFEHDPYQRIEYPTTESLKGLHAYETNKTKKLVHDPDRPTWKVSDMKTGQILSFARLSTPCATMAVEEDDEDSWPEGCNKEMCIPFMEKLQTMKLKIMGERPYYQLDLLATDPKFQGRGAGSMLVEWAISFARRDKMPIYIEASQGIAASLYQKLGFEFVDSFEIELGSDSIKQKYLTSCLIFQP